MDVARIGARGTGKGDGDSSCPLALSMPPGSPNPVRRFGIFPPLHFPPRRPLGNPGWFPGVVLGRCSSHFDPAGRGALQDFPRVQVKQFSRPGERDLTLGQKLERVCFCPRVEDMAECRCLGYSIPPGFEGNEKIQMVRETQGHRLFHRW